MRQTVFFDKKPTLSDISLATVIIVILYYYQKAFLFKFFNKN
jgi:hypothetical protein